MEENIENDLPPPPFKISRVRTRSVSGESTNVEMEMELANTQQEMPNGRKSILAKLLQIFPCTGDQNNLKKLGCYYMNIICSIILVVLVILIFINHFKTQAELQPQVVVSNIVTVFPQIRENFPETSTEDEKAAPQFYNHNIKRNSRFAESVVINIPSKLRTIKEDETIAVTIMKLTSTKIFPSGLSPKSCSSVANLTLSGPISQSWLQYILKNMVNLKNLKVDVDLVASGWTESPSSALFSDLENLSQVSLPYLENLIVENSIKWPIFGWDFQLNIPNLKIVSVKNAKLSSAYFRTFSSQLSKSKDKLETIVLTESSICGNCDLSELQFSQIKNLEISKITDIEDEPKRKQEVDNVDNLSKENVFEG